MHRRIGSRDSWLAVIWRLMCGDDLRTAARHGVATDIALVMTPGTELCRQVDVERLFADM